MQDFGENMFIAGDWGTSHLRLLLCRREENDMITVLDRLNGPGVASCRGQIQEKLFELIDSWVLEYGKLPILLSGMVGSNIGWLEAPYLECPVDIRDIVRDRVQFIAQGHDVSIIPGLSCISPLGQHDLMRGEEMQILGWVMESDINLKGEHLLCLPGTHTKWVRVQDGRIETFQTTMTGELFSLLTEHSVLVMAEQNNPINEDVFMRGVKTIHKAGAHNITSALFGVRSQQIKEALAPEDAAAYLSGHLIGADVLSALSTFRQYMTNLASVTLIGEARISMLFALALNQMGVPTVIAHATDVFLNGIKSVDKLVSEED